MGESDDEDAAHFRVTSLPASAFCSSGSSTIWGRGTSFAAVKIYLSLMHASSEKVSPWSA